MDTQWWLPAGGLLDNVFEWEKAAAGSVFRWDGDNAQTVAERLADLARINAKSTEGSSLLLLAQGKLAKCGQETAWVTSVS